MHQLLVAFMERKAQVVAYVEFLRVLEEAARSGPPKIAEVNVVITVEQQRILYASLYLQLYNLVESTMSTCIDSVSQAASDQARWMPHNLCIELRQEWVRSIARTHVDLTPEHRLTSAMELCQVFVGSLPIRQFAVEKGGGGNWDDFSIEAISPRLGLTLNIPRAVYSAVKRPVKDDKGVLEIVKKYRNSLAHGSISFVECAEDTSVSELIDISERVCNYMEEVVNAFVSYIEGYFFLVPAARPA